MAAVFRGVKKYLLGNDFVDMAHNLSPTEQWWKLPFLGFFGWLWSRLNALYLIAFVDSTLFIVLSLWAADMVSGCVAAWVCGKRDEKGKLVLVGGEPVKGFKAWDSHKAVQGLARGWVYVPVITFSNFLRTWPSKSPVENGVIMAVTGLLDLTVMSIPFVSSIRNVGRASGLTRLERVGDTIEARVDALSVSGAKVSQQLQDSAEIAQILDEKQPTVSIFEKLNIILVDDDEEQRKFIQFLYVGAGHNCLAVGSVDELKLLMENFQPDTVICDLHPLAVPVAEFMVAFPAIPIVGITGKNISNVDVPDLKRMGYKDIVQKMSEGGTGELITKTLFFAHKAKIEMRMGKPSTG